MRFLNELTKPRGLVGLAIAVLFCATLLFSGSRILVYEKMVNPGDYYVVADYGDLGKSDQGSLVCRYFTGRSILTRVFWHSHNDSFGKDQCPFILDEST
jgi:hypothetical protein